MQQQLLEVLGYHIERTFTAATTNGHDMQLHLELAYYAKSGDWNLYWSTVENNGVKEYPLAATEVRLMNIVDKYYTYGVDSTTMQ